MCMCAAYRDPQKHGVYWLSEGQRLRILPVERLKSRHQSLAQLLWLKDWKTSKKKEQASFTHIQQE